LNTIVANEPLNGDYRLVLTTMCTVYHRKLLATTVVTIFRHDILENFGASARSLKFSKLGP
jgi:hypothetical protein